jgi:glycosyltransferase involved in cell wall biosynthesis
MRALSATARSVPEVGTLRVALVGPAFPPQLGGVETYLARLADGLAGLGCNVEVLVQSSHADRPLGRAQMLGSGVVVRRFPSWTRSRQFPLAPALVVFLRRFSTRYDVIHGHSFHAAPASLAALLSQQPFVFSPHYHGGGHTRFARLAHKPYRPVGERAFQRASAVLVNSRSEADLVCKDFALPKETVSVLYPGIDTSEICSADPYPTTNPTILLAGRLEEYKQVQLAIRALPLLSTTCRMVIIGTGSHLSHLKGLASQLGVAHRVAFLGYVTADELHRWYKTAKVFVSLSRHESFGISLVEAIAAGSNVVASDIPTSEEVSGLSGVEVRIVPVDASPSQVATGIRAALDAPSAHVEFSRLPSWSSRADEFLRVYHEVARPTVSLVVAP